MPRHRSTFFVAILLICAGCAEQSQQIEVTNTSFNPGQPWLDSEGKHMNAHGYNIVEHSNEYYWFGSHKIEGLTESQKNEAGVRCYASNDLYNWENQGLILDVNAPGQHTEVADAGILDRPKVVYNEVTSKFVMYFKLYPPGAKGGMLGTRVGYVGVAQSDTICGQYKYKGRFLAANSDEGSGDFAIFKDKDGSIYHITVHKPTKWLYIGKLRQDGLRPDGPYLQLGGIERATEAPTVMYRDGKYYIFGSGSTGWKPNPARLYVSESLFGPYHNLGNPLKGENPHNGLGVDKSFGGQSTYILQLGNSDDWIAMFDIWAPSAPITAGYIWLPIKFQGGQPVIEWIDEWDLSKFNDM